MKYEEFIACYRPYFAETTEVPFFAAGLQAVVDRARAEGRREALQEAERCFQRFESTQLTARIRQAIEAMPRWDGYTDFVSPSDPLAELRDVNGLEKFVIQDWDLWSGPADIRAHYEGIAKRNAANVDLGIHPVHGWFVLLSQGQGPTLGDAQWLTCPCL